MIEICDACRFGQTDKCTRLDREVAVDCFVMCKGVSIAEKKIRADERAKAIDELKSNCIKHIQNQRPLTLTEIIYIIQFEADQMKYTNKN